MCLLIVFDEPQEQTAKRFLLPCPALTLFEKRLNALCHALQFSIVFDNPRKCARE